MIETTDNDRFALRGGRPFAACRSGLLLSAFLALTGAIVGAGETTPSDDARVDLTVAQSRVGGADAAVLRWRQDWSFLPDGTTRRRDHKWVKLFSSRAVRALADPRIDFREGIDDVTIHVARTHLPDGSTLDVPDYGRNRVAPFDVGGWPAYANWQQWVISFSGIEEGVVLELDYEVVSRDDRRWREGDLRLADRYPILERIVSVSRPSSRLLRTVVSLPGRPAPHAKTTQAAGLRTTTWRFTDLPACRDEPLSPPWPGRCGRLVFSTGPDAKQWVQSLLGDVERAAEATPRVSDFAADAAENQTGPADRARAIADAMKSSFNLITSIKATAGPSCRSADTTFAGGYGNPLEAGALLLAALRSQGLAARAWLAVDADLWDESVPTLSSLAGVAVEVECDGGPIWLTPAVGEFQIPSQWGDKQLLRLGPGGALAVRPLPRRGATGLSEWVVTGGLSVNDDGTMTGRFDVRLTGAFFDPLALRSSSVQKRFASDVVGRVLEGFTVDRYAVTVLSHEELRLDAHVSRSASDADGRLLIVVSEPAVAAVLRGVLSTTRRDNAVSLSGVLRERLDLTVSLPQGRVAGVVPRSYPSVHGQWGEIESTTSLEESSIRFMRRVRVDRRTIAPEALAGLRAGLNDLRAAGRRLFTIEKRDSLRDSSAKGM